MEVWSAQINLPVELHAHAPPVGDHSLLGHVPQNAAAVPPQNDSTSRALPSCCTAELSPCHEVRAVALPRTPPADVAANTEEKRPKCTVASPMQCCNSPLLASWDRCCVLVSWGQLGISREAPRSHLSLRRGGLANMAVAAASFRAPAPSSACWSLSALFGQLSGRRASSRWARTRCALHTAARAERARAAASTHACTQAFCYFCRVVGGGRLNAGRVRGGSEPRQQ